jgi:muconate cycloisomerase
MKIERIRTHLVRIPLSVPYVISRGPVTDFTNVVVAIETDDGLVGWGESVPVSLLGDPRRMQAEIVGRLAPALIGEDPRPVETLVDRLLVLAEDLAAVAALDLALWDLLARSLHLPVYALLGGPSQTCIPVDFTLSVDTPSAMAENAVRMAGGGHDGFVVKVPCRSVDEDVARVRAVRAAVPHANLRVDCNGGYRRDDAIAFIRRLADLDVEFVEQPVAREDLAGMVACRHHGVAISADESLSTPADALAIVCAGACDVLNVKISKAGGLLQARRIAANAAAAGLPMVVGGSLSFGITRFASRHLAASSGVARNIRHEGPAPASQALTDDITFPATSPPRAGVVELPEGPGLGFTIEAVRLDRYTI